jgi:cyclin A
MKKKTTQRNSTSKDYKDDKTYKQSQTENSNSTNTNNFKLNTIRNFYSNSELAGNFNSNLNSKNKEFSKEKGNSYGCDYDDYEKDGNLNFTEKINISSCFDYDMKKNNNLDNFNHKKINSKNYINNFNTDQNMRNSEDHYNQISYENKVFRNKQTPPKYNNNDYDEDYQMLEESIQSENTGNTEPIKINEIKNIKIQKKNQKKKKSLNDSNEENINICPSQNIKMKINNNISNINNNNNDDNYISKNNINIFKKANNNTKINPLGNKDNLPNQKEKDLKNKNNKEAYFPKEKKQQQKQKLEENIYVHIDSLENKENFYHQEENMMKIEDSDSNNQTENKLENQTKTQSAIDTQLIDINININNNNIKINYQQKENNFNTKTQNDYQANKENIKPKDNLGQINANTSFNSNPIENININSNANIENQINNNNYENINPRNQSDSNSRFIPILVKYENQIPLEYIPEIWKSLKSSENSEACKPHFEEINNQRDINFDMRAILIDWIVEVHKNYRLFHETLFLSISIIDRYLSIKNINRTKLQLLGTTALFIASKYEEIVYPCLSDFSNITDSAYEKEEILEMEKEILLVLKYDITYPSPFRFFEIISLNYNFSEVEFYYGCFLMEYFLLSSNHTKYYPSIIALAVVLLILRLKKYDSYRDLYNLTDPENQKLIKECAREIYEFPNRCRMYNLNSVLTKYSSQTFHCVAVYQMENPVMDVNLNSNINNNNNPSINSNSTNNL